MWLLPPTILRSWILTSSQPHRDESLRTNQHIQNCCPQFIWGVLSFFSFFFFSAEDLVGATSMHTGALISAALLPGDVFGPGRTSSIREAAVLSPSDSHVLTITDDSPEACTSRTITDPSSSSFCAIPLPAEHRAALFIHCLRADLIGGRQDDWCLFDDE